MMEERPREPIRAKPGGVSPTCVRYSKAQDRTTASDFAALLDKLMHAVVHAVVPSLGLGKAVPFGVAGAAKLAQLWKGPCTAECVTGPVIVAAVIADVYQHRFTWRPRGAR